MTAKLLTALGAISVSLAVAGCSKPADNAAPAATAAAPVAAAPATTAPAPVAEQAAAPAPVAAAAAPQASAPIPVFTPVAPPAAAAPAAQARLLKVPGFAAEAPAAWTATEPSSSMRMAQFNVPGARGAEGGEAAVFFFPSGQGGPQSANIERWASQFTGADGKPVTPKVSTAKSGPNEITLVELHGNYARGVGMGPDGNAKPNQTLIVAMVETAAGRITLQLYGPAATVAAQREAFLKLATGFRPA
ncbi:MAG TPA: hypothetical protein VNT33_04920 [Telluria sp.]|nr:hypothetical protein [Telluria sp.]